MSSVQTRENRVRRKSKVSDARLFRVGLVGSLAEAERRRRWTSGQHSGTTQKERWGDAAR
jgi:hypothetical protein